MLNRFRSLLIGATGLVLVGCGAKEHHVIMEPTRPLSSFAAVEVKPFTIASELDPHLNEKKRKELEELTDMIGLNVVELLRQREVPASAEAEERLVIEGKVVSYTPGSQALRYWVGMGAGASKMIAEVQFKDAQGNAIGSAEFVGGVTSGGFGGHKTDAVRRMADEIAEYVVAELPKPDGQ